MEAIIAVEKLLIWKPGTTMLTPQSKKTLIKRAKRPKVKRDMGRAIICKIGLRKVLTIPITIAATVADQISFRIKPGTKYSTTNRAKTFMANLINKFMVNGFRLDPSFYYYSLYLLLSI